MVKYDAVNLVTPCDFQKEMEEWLPRFHESLPNCPNIFCLGGGEDIHKSVYVGSRDTRDAPDRDIVEAWEYLRNLSKHPEWLRLGICRGGQMMNVLNGGGMLQHVSGHDPAKHITEYLGVSYTYNSMHHQAMIPSETGEAIIVEESVVEGVWYPKTKTMCFQPHPELDKETSSLLWAILNDLLFSDEPEN